MQSVCLWRTLPPTHNVICFFFLFYRWLWSLSEKHLSSRGKILRIIKANNDQIAYQRRYSLQRPNRNSLRLYSWKASGLFYFTNIQKMSLWNASQIFRLKRKPLDLKCMPNIANIRKKKTQSNLSGSTGSILVRTTGLVASKTSVIA